MITALSRGRVSFLAFCAANVLIDIESGYNMLTEQPRIHTFLHTYIGATLAAMLVVPCFYAARWLGGYLPESSLTTWRRLPIGAVIVGAFLGAWSHVVFDSVMHADITPLAPFSNSNVLYRVISLETLHLSCLGAGAIGLAWWIRKEWLLRSTRREHVD